MSLVWAIAALLTGLVLLWKCADVLVCGAVAIAERFGLSPFVIGLTIVAMGTSAPEVAASVAAVFSEGGGDIAIGNVCGSNIANLALVAGVVTLIRPLRIQRATLRREVPIMIAVVLLLGGTLWNGTVGRWESLALLVVFGGFLAWTVKLGRSNMQASSPVEGAVRAAGGSSVALLSAVWRVVLGLIGLALGARMAVYGATVLGRAIGISEAVIGLTIVSIGTSLPELITCVVAAVKEHDDISVGNLVGSNIFNTLLVTGVSGLSRPFEVSARFAGGNDYWVMVGVSLLFAGLSWGGRGCIKRRAGIVLLGIYVAYLCYLFLVSPVS
jgi:cation:H+ antiporter